MDQIELLLNSKMEFKDILNLDDNIVEGFYAAGYHFNRAGEKSKAMRYFRLLCMLDPFNPKYSFALASLLHEAKEYKQAAALYLLTALHDRNDPSPWLNLADCYFNLNLIREGIASLYIVIGISGDEPQYEHFKQKAEIILNQDEYAKICQDAAAQLLKESPEKAA